MNDSQTGAQLDASLAAVRELVRKRTAPLAALPLTMLTVVAGGGGLFLAAMWATEREALPLRTQAGFALCLGIAAAWTAFGVHGLVRRRAPLARQRVIAGAMALAFCVTFTLFGVAVAWSQGDRRGTLAVIATGITMSVCAATMLVRATRERADLLSLRAQIEHRRPETSNGGARM